MKQELFLIEILNTIFDLNVSTIKGWLPSPGLLLLFSLLLILLLFNPGRPLVFKDGYHA